MQIQRWFTAAWCVGVVCAVSAQGQSSDEAVKALELQRFEAMTKNDFASLERLLADDLVYTHSTGIADTKAQYLESLRSGKTRYVNIAPDDLHVRIFGDTAVIRGRAALTMNNPNETSFKISFLDVWVKRNSRWQMVAWQSARLPTSDK
jgi:ketosteroid isomerase-like protein